MAKQTINQGTAPTGAGGDTFRSGSAKLQANDDELYNALGANASGVLPAALPLTKGGTGATTAAAARTNLGLGTAATRDTGTSSGNVMLVGAFGLGGGFSSLSQTISIPSEMPIGLSLSMATTDKLGLLNNATWQGVSLLSLRSYPDQSVGSANHVQAAFFGSRLFLRGGSAGSGTNTFSAWAEVRSTANTTVDGNGFVKAASPVVKLFADKIELNDEAQQQEITFEKLGVGDYLVKGSTGFSQDGWYIETPKDANGNLLVAVVYEQLENGDISVKTYDYMLNKKGRIVADTETPLDIPESRWIDLRLQELPQPEIEMPGLIAPPDFQPTGLAQAVATVMESYHDPEQ